MMIEQENEQATGATAIAAVDAAPTAGASKKKTYRSKKAQLAQAASSKLSAPRSRGFSEEDKQAKVKQIDDDIASGTTLKDAAKNAGVSDQSYYQWKKALKPNVVAKTEDTPAISFDDELAEFASLENENRELRRLLAEKLRTENADLRKRLGLK